MLDWLDPAADVAPWLAVPTSLAVLDAVGLNRVQEYNHGLLAAAVPALLDAWGTQGALGLHHRIGMVAVEMPLGLLGALGLTPDASGAGRVNRWLRERHSIEVPVAFVGGRLWCRLSAQIYNVPEDYARLGRVVVDELGKHE